MKRDCKSVWSECLDLIKEQVLPRTFKTWFAPIRALSFKDDVLTIQVPSQYVYECLEEHFVDILRKAVRTAIGPNAKLEYSVVVEESHPRDPLSVTMPSNNMKKVEPNTVYVNGKPDRVAPKNPFERNNNRLQIDPQLNPAYTLDSYIEGSCNRLAKSAAVAIAQNPGGTAFNPLLIYGGSGLGKTHLAQAIGMEVKQNYPNKVVLYVTTNVFQTQFTEAVRKNEINDFLHFYQLIDVLILDDIHELAGKTATQNTFFHIFNHLHQSGKQLILTSDRSPAELSGLEERLLSRFRWGLSAEIKAPDFETRMEIARFKAHKDGIDFSDEVLEYICKYVSNNVRELEGAMISLLAQATFNHKDLTVDVVKDILGKMVKNQKVELTVEHIQQVICNHFNMAPEMLQEKTRKREVVQARQLAMYFSKTYTNASLAYIGKQIGKKDHTTVLYACMAVNDLMETDRAFKAQVEELQKKLYCRN